MPATKSRQPSSMAVQDALLESASTHPLEISAAPKATLSTPRSLDIDSDLTGSLRRANDARIEPDGSADSVMTRGSKPPRSRPRAMLSNWLVGPVRRSVETRKTTRYAGQSWLGSPAVQDSWLLGKRPTYGHTPALCSSRATSESIRPRGRRTRPRRVVISCTTARQPLIALASVQRQTCPPDEILVVDDGSTDASCAVGPPACTGREHPAVARDAQWRGAAARNTGLLRAAKFGRFSRFAMMNGSTSISSSGWRRCV